MADDTRVTCHDCGRGSPWRAAQNWHTFSTPDGRLTYFYCDRCGDARYKRYGTCNPECKEPKPDEDGSFEYRLLVPFLTDEPLFARGWEAGLLYAEMRESREEISGYYNALNEEQHHLTARNMGYAVEQGERTEDGHWVALTFRRQGDG